MKSWILASTLILAAHAASADTHRGFVCTTGGNVEGFIFAYDTHGHVSEGRSRPGYCILPNSGTSKDPRPYGQYFCWVMDTQTAKTTDGQLAILFKKPIGDHAIVYHQLNVPADAKDLDSFEGRVRAPGMAPRGLSRPLDSENSDRMTCKAQELEFERP